MRGWMALSVWLLAPAQIAHGQTGENVGDQLDQLAIETFDRVQPLSIRDGIEYCGVLGFDRDGTLVATPATPGERDSCESDPVPDGFEVLASYHTHGAYAPDADTEAPSLDDLLGDFEEGIDGYLATPGGRVWLTVSDDRKSYEICGPGCVAADPMFEECAEFPTADEYTLEMLRRREALDTGAC